MSLPLRDRDAVALPIILLALVLGYGALFAPTTPLSGRPALASRALPPADLLQKYPARLWQDPLLATEDAARSGGSTGAQALSAESAGVLLADSLPLHKADEQQHAADLRLILLAIPGGRYHEDSEQRLRARYAAVQALLDSGYRPQDPDRLGAFLVAGLSNGVVPFELYLPPTSTAGISAKKIAPEPNHKVPTVVMYASDELLTPVAAPILLGNIVDFTRAAARSRPTAAPTPLRVLIRTIGPLTSDDLLKLPDLTLRSSTRIRWLVGPDNVPAAETSLGTPLVWETPYATLASTVNASPSVVRRVAPDDRLAELIVSELKTRIRGLGSLQSTARVLLVYELDSSYGRAIEWVVREKLTATAADAQTSTVHSIGYLRGIDGLRESASKKDSPKAPERPDPTDRLDLPNSRGPFVSEASGEQQGDYLARTAQLVRSLEDKAGEPFTAIGVLGTDFYDKSLILQVLRPAFPGAVFFTTDLDARMLEPGVFPYFRNVIVASSYGLSLPKNLQESVPPFRDSYQTGLFLATKLAINDREALSYWKTHVAPTEHCVEPATKLGHVFEIGRSGAWLLPPSTPPSASPLPAPAEPRRLGVQLDWGWSLLPRALIIGILLAFLSFVWVWSNPARDPKVERPIRRAVAKRTTPRDPWPLECFLLWCVLAIAVVLSAAAFAGVPRCFAALGWVGEPADPTAPDGVNAWPTIAATFLIGVASFLYAALQLRNSLSRGIEHISAEYGLTASASLAPTTTRYSIAGWKPAEPTQIISWWGEFRVLSEPWPTVTRVAVFVMLYMLMGVLAWVFVSPTTGGNLRGVATYIAFAVAYTVAGLGVSTLLFMIWDATRLCEAAIRWLDSGPSKYPEHALHPIAIEYNVDHPVAACWLDIQIAGRLTRRVGRALPLPFLAIFGLLAARSVAIDFWHPNPALYTTCVVLGAIIVLATARLQHAARHLRATELRRFDALLATALTPENKDSIAILKEHVEEYRVGAFASWTQNPIVGALITAAGALAISVLNGMVT